MLVDGFDPSNGCRTAFQHLDSEPSERAGIIHANRLSECASGVMRENYERSALIVLGHKPGDGHFLSPGADRGTVDRTSFDAPVILMHDVGNAPATSGETRDVNVTHLIGAPVSECHHHAL
jgi:hypothetical protein